MVPREKYPEMNWRAADKVAAWRAFKRRMNVIFVVDQVPEERQWALILVAGGDEAYNCWDTLEERVKDRKKVEQVWNAFKKSFKQSTSFWPFRDTYLADFRQDESETTADLDLHIKQTVNGRRNLRRSEWSTCCTMPPSTTRYVSLYKSQNLPHWHMSWSSKRQRLMSITFLSTKTIKLPTGEQTVHLPTTTQLLSAHALSKRWPSGCGNNGQHCGKCGKSHERGNCPAYGKTCDKCKGINHFKAVCRSKVTAKMGHKR